MTTLQMTFPPVIETPTNLKLMLVFNINGREIALCFLPEWMIKTVENVQPVSQSALSVIITGYNYLRNLFFSYFVVNLLNFLTLTLLYNYLNIPSQPSFSHNFLEKLSKILFLQNDLVEMVAKIVSDPQLQSRLDFGGFVTQPEKVA